LALSVCVDILISRAFLSLFCGFATTPEIKKADVAKHPRMLNHVGLLVNWPALRGLPFI
jgi:hypothetical protein